MNICDPVGFQAWLRPYAPALVEPGRVLSYGDLNRRLEGVARWLLQQGLKSGERVAIFLPDSVDHVVCALGIVRAGLVSVSLDYRAPPRMQATVLSRVSPSLVMAGRSLDAVDDVPVLRIDEDWLAARAIEPRGDFPVGPELDAFIALSSGTTGPPKGVVLSHANLFARRFTNEFSVAAAGGSDRGRYLSCAPLYFSAARNHVIYHLIAGDTVVLQPPLFSAAELAEAITRYRIDSLFLVPTTLRLLLDHDGAEGPLFPRPPFLIYGGASSSAAEKRRIVDRFDGNCLEVYASSGSGTVSVLLARDVSARGDSVGRLVSPDSVEIVDDEGHRLPAGESGRLRCCGAMVSRGFFPADDGSRDERFVAGYCYPGELAAVDDGFLYLRGRASSLIVRGGTNIYPEQIEHVVSEHPAIAMVAVTAIEVPPVGEEPVVLVVRSGEIAEDELLRFCAERLSPHHLPRLVRFVDSLPTTGSGKIRRADLKDMALRLIS